MNTQLLTKVLFQAKNLSPTLLTAAGVVGVVASTVMACRATLKVDEVVKNHTREIDLAKEYKGSIGTDSGDVFPYPQVVARTYLSTCGRLTRLYGPAVIVGVLSIGAIAGGHTMLLGRNTALAGALAATEKAFDKYRKAVASEIGVERERELRYQRYVDEVKDPETGEIKDVVKVDLGRSPYARFFDETCPNWERNNSYNKMFLTTQQEYANQRLRAQGFLLLNDVYRSLGFEQTTAGAVVGWALGEGDDYVDFGMYDFENPKNGEALRRFADGDERSILLDFNVAGPVYHLIGDGNAHV